MVRLSFLLAVCTVFSVHAHRVQHEVYWNSTNPVFEPFDNAIDSPGYYELSARPLDTIKFHCPKRKIKEYSLIYKVSFEEFQRCSLGPNAELVVSCDGEHHTVRYTLIPDETEPGQVYFITTSSGRKEGLYNRRLGLCNEKNMRMAVIFDGKEMILRRDPVLGSDVDLQRLLKDRFYLAEENGELNWKKNVLPDVDFDWKTYLQNHNRKLKFDKSLQIEPIPLDDEFVSRWEELRGRNQRIENELGFLVQAEEAAQNFLQSAGQLPLTARI
ncbi:Ephrin [Oesophagostomum dentatum]|uniref:Ephrin n=1 Tax=Oesophagostomum dentatum TaxID=61180 RepID=A0A0B1SV08_OESDE|nr:Ephrin [Oesophagostomum dentatum]